MSIGEFAEALAQYRAITAASVVSGGRTPERNVRVGGVAFSAHLVDRAADLVYDAPPDAGWRVELGRRLGLLILPEGDHDHVQPLDWAAG